MMNLKPHRIERAATKNVGEPSSKYGYDADGSQFAADMQKHAEQCEFLWNEFVDFMKSHDVDPRKFRFLFTKYHEEFLKG